MKTHIVAHSIDPDGIIAHVLFQILSSGDNTEHHFVDYPDVKQTLERISLNIQEPDYPSIYVADIDLSSTLRDENIFSRLENKSHIFSWYDHHKGSIEGRDFLQRYCYSVNLAANKCAAELVQEQFLRDDHYAEFLADIAHAHDFGKGELLPRGNELQDIISSGHDLSVLVMNLMKKKVWNFSGNLELSAHYQEVVSSFRTRKEEAYRRLEESLEHINIAGVPVLFAFADSFLYMKEAPDHLRAKFGTTADYIVVAYAGKENVMAYGQRGGGKHVVAFCQSMNGGGRGHGGGFLLDHKVTPETYHQDRTYVQERLQQFLTNHSK